MSFRAAHRRLVRSAVQKESKSIAEGALGA